MHKGLKDALVVYMNGALVSSLVVCYGVLVSTYYSWVYGRLVCGTIVVYQMMTKNLIKKIG